MCSVEPVGWLEGRDASLYWSDSEFMGRDPTPEPCPFTHVGYVGCTLYIHRYFGYIKF